MTIKLHIQNLKSCFHFNPLISISSKLSEHSSQHHMSLVEGKGYIQYGNIAKLWSCRGQSGYKDYFLIVSPVYTVSDGTCLGAPAPHMITKIIHFILYILQSVQGASGLLAVSYFILYVFAMSWLLIKWCLALPAGPQWNMHVPLFKGYWVSLPKQGSTGLVINV